MPYKVSVIIPVFNAESSLQKCVESILYGEFHDVKIILVDDCSSDESWDICCRLSRQHNNVICKQNDSNRGVSYTRNQGLTEAEGKYIFFVDSDDWVSSKYITRLYSAAEQNDNLFTLCGFKLIDKIEGERKNFLWNNNLGEIYRVTLNDSFEMQEKTLLQQLWNKAFRRDVIKKYQICFAEDQSMGEDFQFVLDYIEAASLSGFLILNDPLYYYIRANKNSLMSRFGLEEIENGYRRLKQLLKIAGDEGENVQKYERAIENSKNNAVYQAVRCDFWTKAEKLNYIETIMTDGKAFQHYREQYLIRNKERLAYGLKRAKKTLTRLKSRLKRGKRDILVKEIKALVKCRDFSVISQNCIGGVLYHDLGMKFTSPTIDLFFSCSDFVKFVLNLDYYLNQELIIMWGEEYPIGYLDDIIINFQHYNNCEEAKTKWEMRKRRIHREKIIVLCTDMEGFTEAVFEQWKKIPYPKILFSAIDRKAPEVVYYPEYLTQGKVNDLIPDRKFYRNHQLVDMINGL